MYWKTLEINALKYMNLILLIFYQHLYASMFKKRDIKLELLKVVDMLLMIEKSIRSGICHAIHRYAKINDNYMKNYDNYKKSSYSCN